jgi:hypothetical protein
VPLRANIFSSLVYDDLFLSLAQFCCVDIQARAFVIAKNLIVLVSGANLAEQTCFEELVRAVMHA